MTPRTNAPTSGSRARTVSDALRVVPGVSLTATHGGTAVRIHGYDPQQVLVVVDGQPVIGRVTFDLDREARIVRVVDAVHRGRTGKAALVRTEVAGASSP